MSAITVRNLDPSTHRALKARARAHARSTEAEVRAILNDVVKSKSEKGLGTLLREFGEKYGTIEFERDKSLPRVVSFD